MDVERVHHTGLTVSDIDRSIAFYTKVLGGELMYEGRSETQGVPRKEFQNVVGVKNAKLKYAFLRFQDTLIELICYESPRGRVSRLRHNDVGTPHIAFKVQDIYEAFESLSRKGVKFLNPPVEVVTSKKAWSNGWRFTYFRGPDREFLEIFQELA
jgi:catechol 2,3-dioxygenase-like lactoylglutathione lyase family enzyme